MQRNDVMCVFTNLRFIFSLYLFLLLVVVAFWTSAAANYVRRVVIMRNNNICIYWQITIHVLFHSAYLFFKTVLSSAVASQRRKNIQAARLAIMLHSFFLDTKFWKLDTLACLYLIVCSNLLSKTVPSANVVAYQLTLVGAVRPKGVIFAGWWIDIKVQISIRFGAISISLQ